MIQVRLFVQNPFQENTYLLINELNECILVDPGSYSEKEQNQLIDFIEDNSLRLVRILLTHGHVDHILGAAFFADFYKLPVEHHFNETELLEMAPKQAAGYGFYYSPPAFFQPSLSESQPIVFGDSTLHFLDVPGHTKGSVAIWSEKDAWVITGDVLFRGSIGRTDLHGGDYDQLMDSILRKLLVLPYETRVYPGHGPSTTILSEMQENPFITEFLRGVSDQ